MDTRTELRKKRWSAERAADYMEKFGVIKGVNYVPAYAPGYISMWQDFREHDIRRELDYAVEIGINAVRIFLWPAQW